MPTIECSVTESNTFQILDPLDIIPAGAEEGQYLESGTTLLPIGQQVVDIAFLTAKVSADYLFDEKIIRNEIDASPLVPAFIISGHSLTGFQITLSSAPDTASSYFKWKVRIPVTGTTTGGTTTISSVDLTNYPPLSASNVFTGATNSFVGDLVVTPLSSVDVLGTDVNGKIGLAGNIGITHFNSGTGADATSYWRGDGTWATISNFVDLGSAQVLTNKTLSGLANTLVDIPFTAFENYATSTLSLVDPNADRVAFWDDSAASFAWLTMGTNLSITGTTLNATGGAGGAVATDVIWDAKGDLAVGTGVDTAIRLAVGANGSFYMADSTTATGTKWSTLKFVADAIGPGDLLVGGVTNFIGAILADTATGNALLSGGVDVSPFYGKITSSHVDSTIPLKTDNLSVFAATTSAQLKGVLSDELGDASGKVIFSLGTLAIASGKTLTASNTLTLQGTDGSTLDVGTGGTLGTAAYTAATAYQGADADLTTWAGITPGTGVGAALAINVGSAGALVTNGGALGTPSSGVATNLTGTAAGLTAGNVTTNANLTGHVTSTGNAAVLGSFTLAQLNTAVSDDNVAGLGAANTFTAQQINSYTGTASTPAMKYSGVPFAGTGTTSFPLLYINDANATASTTLNTAGTYLGVNGDGTQDLLNLLKDGASVFKVTSTGTAEWAGAAGANTLTGSRITLGGNTRLTGSTTTAATIDNVTATLPFRLNLGRNDVNAPAFTADSTNGITLTSAAGTATWNDLNTAGSGTVSNRYLFGIAAPTLTATNASVTDTVASTVYIGGAPIASTNTTITTPYALNVAGGVSKFAGPIVSQGYTVATLPSTAATGMVVGALAYVTDALTPTFLTLAVGGGAVISPVFYNGTNWVTV